MNTRVCTEFVLDGCFSEVFSITLPARTLHVCSKELPKHKIWCGIPHIDLRLWLTGVVDLKNFGRNSTAGSVLGDATNVWAEDLNRTSMVDEYLGSTKLAAHLDHNSSCKTSSGSKWSDRWLLRYHHKHSPRLDRVRVLAQCVHLFDHFLLDVVSQ